MDPNFEISQGQHGAGVSRDVDPFMLYPDDEGDPNQPQRIETDDGADDDSIDTTLRGDKNEIRHGGNPLISDDDITRDRNQVSPSTLHQRQHDIEFTSPDGSGI